MRELVLTSAIAMLGAGCVEVIPHIDEFDAGPDITVTDVIAEEVSSGKCMSGRRWTMGTMGSPLMNPGVPCMGPGCHSPTASKPQLVMTLGGTIYPLGGEHDDNDCNGIDGAGMAVAVMEENGPMEVIPRIQVTPVGNFFTNRPLPDRYKVKVIQGGREAPMTTVVNGAMNGGDCNYCHSAADFMGAKGRIVPAKP